MADEVIEQDVPAADNGAQFKTEIAGLNRKITELQQERERLASELEKEKVGQQTVEQQVAELRAEARKQREEAEQREKRLKWQSEAARLGIPDTLVNRLDPSAPYEEGLEAIVKLNEWHQDRVKADVNKQLADGYKPKSPGDAPDEKKVDTDKLKGLDFHTMAQMSDKELAGLYGGESE